MSGTVSSTRLGTLWNMHLAANWYPITAVVRTVVRRAPPHRRATYLWARDLCRRHDVRLRDLGSEPMLSGRPFLLLCPHRSSADFFVHKYIADGRAATLSRLGVAFYAPFAWVGTQTDRATWYFKRGRKGGRDRLFGWLDEQFERAWLDGLILYPEGHRNTEDTPLKLKGGMLLYAHQRKMPVQILMTAGTEHVINEKTLTCNYGVDVPYRFEAPIESADYSRLSEFYRAVSDVFSRSFAEVRQARQG